ncbi:MAG: RsmB/NOP family class I SAM-dependent RNA methyltransferase [Thermodesulfobacteriota bacterium]
MAKRWFRLCCAADDDARVLGLLAAEGFAAAAEPYWDGAYALIREPSALGSSLAAHFGLIYIQDRSSMLPPLALAPASGATCLDLCASPGGKTGLLARLVGPQGFVLGNEPTRDRLATLRMNLARTGALNAATSSFAGEDAPLPDAAWPWVLLDPPCSGWGTADKHPKVLSLWREDKVGPLASLQRRLLARASRLLAPGGRLVYSTCTTNPAENEDQAAYAAQDLGLAPVPLSPPPGVELREPVRPDTPGVLRVEGGDGQGFFLAAFVRPAAPGESPEPAAELPPLGRDLSPGELASCPAAAWEQLPPGRPAAFGERVFFLHAGTARLPDGLRWQGCPLGRVKAGRFLPEPRARALLRPFAPGAGYDAQEPAELRRLLSGQAVSGGGLPDPAGLYFRGLPLGWLRIKGGRALWQGG